MHSKDYICLYIQYNAVYGLSQYGLIESIWLADPDPIDSFTCVNQVMIRGGFSFSAACNRSFFRRVLPASGGTYTLYWWFGIRFLHAV